MKRLLLIIAVMLTGLAGCKHLDTDRIPPAPVRLAFNTVADWNTYGVPGALGHRRYIKSERIPGNFPYTALSQTGFGGVLIVGDIMGAPRAYDLACPVEVNRNVRIEIDTQENVAYCPKCGSRYSVFNNYGSPISGEARKLKRGLRRFNVGPGMNGEFMVVSR